MNKYIEYDQETIKETKDQSNPSHPLAYKNRERQIKQSGFEDIFQINPEIKITDGEYNSREATLIAILDEIKITMTSAYGSENPMAFVCDVCQHEFYADVKRIKRYGCPKCRLVQMNIQYEKRLWQRSGQIVKDKHGHVIRLQECNPEKRPKLDDKFVLRCEAGHNFTTTHRALRRDVWCPICAQKGNIVKRTSSFIYKNKANTVNTETITQRKLSTVCDLKEIYLLSKLLDNGCYNLQCMKCKTKFSKNARQIYRNIYLCPNKCFKGKTINPSMLG